MELPLEQQRKGREAPLPRFVEHQPRKRRKQKVMLLLKEKEETVLMSNMNND